METDFTKLLSSMSDERLQEYIDKREKYNPGAVLSAIEELKKRGKIFTDQEIETIKADLDQQQEAGKQRTEVPDITSTKRDSYLTESADAPEYYSQNAIYGFSLFFGILFSSILMAINISKTENKQGIVEIVSFGIGYTALQIWIVSLINGNTGLTLLFGIGGAFLINNFFWKKHIGATPYRARAIWIPLGIGIAISALFLVAILYG